MVYLNDNNYYDFVLFFVTVFILNDFATSDGVFRDLALTCVIF